MCIIAIKPAGVKKPTQEQFKAMCESNRNGFGYMTWNKKHGLQVYKTMDEQDYMEHVNKIPDEQPVVYHMRIATHGSVQKKNCHPFVDGTRKWGFAHNGILSIHNEGDMTDSETFFKRIAMPLIYAGIKPKSKPFDKMIDCIIGSSKFVFLNSEGELFYYGNFIKEKGLLFSNSSYQPRPAYSTLLCGGSYGGGRYGGYYWGDDYYNDDWRGMFKKKEEPKEEVCDMSDKDYDDLCDFLESMADSYTNHIPHTLPYIKARCKSRFKNVAVEDFVDEAIDLLGVTYEPDKLNVCQL